MLSSFFKIDRKVVQIKIVNQSCVVVFPTNRRNLKFLKLLYDEKLPKTIFFFFAYLIYLFISSFSLYFKDVEMLLAVCVYVYIFDSCHVYLLVT